MKSGRIISDPSALEHAPLPSERARGPTSPLLLRSSGRSKTQVRRGVPSAPRRVSPRLSTDNASFPHEQRKRCAEFFQNHAWQSLPERPVIERSTRSKRNGGESRPSILRTAFTRDSSEFRSTAAARDQSSFAGGFTISF